MSIFYFGIGSLAGLAGGHIVHGDNLHAVRTLGLAVGLLLVERVARWIQER